jgi:DNA-binding LacI/PurR family transcriptional regulator
MITVSYEDENMETGMTSNSAAGSSKRNMLIQVLREFLIKGGFKPGDRLPTEANFCKTYNLSMTTVREAVGALEHDGLIRRIQGKGLFVGERIVAGTIAVVAEWDRLTSMSGLWYTQLMKLATDRIGASGRRPILMVGNGNTTEEFLSSINLLDKPVARETHGVLNLVNVDKMEERLAKAGINSVTVEAAVATSKYCVVLAYDTLTEMGANYLKDHGHDNFAIMYHENFQPHIKELMEPIQHKIRSILMDTVGSDEERLIAVPYTPDFRHACDAFREWWSRPNRPKAIFFHDDNLFEVASRTILEMGIRVPEELSIVTHANTCRQFHFPAPITRVVFDAAEVTDAAWSMLDALISGRPVDNSVVYIQPRLQPGESVG